jgi:hypothetical protein
MKRLITLIIAIFIVIAATLFYVGVKTEDTFRGYIEKYDQTWKEKYDLSIRLVSYSKSLLSANAEFEIDVIDPATRKELAEVVKLPLRSKFKIQHGPVFINNGIHLGIAHVNSNISISDLVSEIYEQDFSEYVEDARISVDVDFGISGEVGTEIIIDGIDIYDKGSKNRFVFSPIKISLQSNNDTNPKAYKSSLKFDNLTVNLPELYLGINGVSFDSNVKSMFGNLLPIGEFSGAFDEILIRTSGTNIQPLNLSIQHNSIAKDDEGKLFSDANLVIIIKNADKLIPPLPVDLVEINATFSGLAEKDVASFDNIISVSPSMDGDSLVGMFGPWFNNILSGEDLEYSFNVSVSQDNTQLANTGMKLGYVGHKFATDNLDQTLVNLEKNLLDVFTVEADISLNKSLLQALGKDEAYMAELMLSGLIKDGLIEEISSNYSSSLRYKDGLAEINKIDYSKYLVSQLSQIGLIDLCGSVDGDWYFYYPPDTDYPDDIVFGRFSIEASDGELNSGSTNVFSVILNLNDKTTFLDEYVETWDCANSQLTFSGFYEDNSTYTFSGQITSVGQDNFVWDDEELGEYTFSRNPHYSDLGLIEDQNLRMKLVDTINYLTERDGFHPINYHLKPD